MNRASSLTSSLPTRPGPTGRATLVFAAALLSLAARADPETPARLEPALAATAPMAPAGVASRPVDATGRDVAGAPPASRWASRHDYSQGNYSWSLARGSVDVALGFDTPSRIGYGAGSRLDASGPIIQTLPELSVGLRTVAPGLASSLIERAIGTAGGRAASSRVGIQWKPAPSNLAFLRQGLGIRLGGDERFTMRLRKGTLSLYMKQEF